jgi:hypothetical protein
MIAFAPIVFLSSVLSVPSVSDPQPPTTPPIYEVWGFRWDGRQYVKQPTHCLSTTDLKQAADYAAEINRYPGWTATTNLPPGNVRSQSFGGSNVRGRRTTGRHSTERRHWIDTGTVDSGSTNVSAPYDNFWDIQNMINTQNMINAMQSNP